MVSLPEDPPGEFPYSENHSDQPSNFLQIFEKMRVVIINLVQLVKLKCQTNQIVLVIVKFLSVDGVSIIVNLHFFKQFVRKPKMVKNLTLKQIDFKVKIGSLVHFDFVYDFVQHYCFYLLGVWVEGVAGCFYNKAVPVTLR